MYILLVHLKGFNVYPTKAKGRLHGTKKLLYFEVQYTSSSGNSTTGWGEGVRGEGGAISTGRGCVTRGLKLAPLELPLSS